MIREHLIREQDPEWQAAERAAYQAELAVANADIRDATRVLAGYRAHAALVRAQHRAHLARISESASATWNEGLRRARIRAELDVDDARDRYIDLLDKPIPDTRPLRDRYYAAERALRDLEARLRPVVGERP